MQKLIEVLYFWRLLSAMREGADFAVYPQLSWRDGTTSISGFFPGQSGCVLTVKAHEHATTLVRAYGWTPVFTSQTTTFVVPELAPQRLYEVLHRHFQFDPEIEVARPKSTDSLTEKMFEGARELDPHFDQRVAQVLDNFDREQDDVVARHLAGQTGWQATLVLPNASDSYNRWTKLIDRLFGATWRAQYMRIEPATSPTSTPFVTIGLSHHGGGALWYMLKHMHECTEGRLSDKATAGSGV